MAPIEEEDSLLEDDLETAQWGSPAQKRTNKQTQQSAKGTTTHTDSVGEKEREAMLRQELANVRKVNEAIEGVLANLHKAENNMKTVNQTVGASSSLLNTWTRILSQTEHNQRLILDPTWHGASQDIVDIEEEATAKQHAAEKREQEEQDRKAAVLQKAEEDERKRAEATKVTKPATARGRGRGGLRGSSSVASASANTSTSSIARGSSSHRRTASGIGRGLPNRGRGRT